MSFCKVCVLNHPTCGCIKSAGDVCLDDAWENNLKSNVTNGDVMEVVDSLFSDGINAYIDYANDWLDKPYKQY